VTRTLRDVMRRGSLCAAAEIAGHKDGIIGRRLRAADQQTEAITEALVHDLHLTEVEVDTFGLEQRPSFHREHHSSLFVYCWRF